jgi:hypothetical protein
MEQIIAAIDEQARLEGEEWNKARGYADAMGDATSAFVECGCKPAKSGYHTMRNLVGAMLEQVRRECPFFERVEGHEESHMGAMGGELYPPHNRCYIGGNPDECNGNPQKCPFQRQSVGARLEQVRAEAASEKAVIEAKKRIESGTGDIVALIGKGALEAIKEQARREEREWIVSLIFAIEQSDLTAAIVQAIREADDV